VLLNRTSLDSAATENAALTWEPVYSRVGGDLPINELARFVPHAGVDPTSFVRFEIEVSTPGKVKLVWGDSAGLTLWLDGKPTTLTAENVFDLAAGRHVVTLAVSQAKQTQPLRVELQDVEGSPAQAQLVGGK
jgi:hypothetical protein